MRGICNAYVHGNRAFGDVGGQGMRIPAGCAIILNVYVVYILVNYGLTQHKHG